MTQKILFDLTATQPDSKGTFHGGSEYTKFIFFNAIGSGFTNFDAVYNSTKPISDRILELCERNQIQIHKIQKNRDLESLIQTREYKTFFSALCYTYANLDFGDTVSIFTIHGLRPLEMPIDPSRHVYSSIEPRWLSYALLAMVYKLYLYQKNKKDFARIVSGKNKKIITVSKHSKYSILSFFPDVKEENLHVFHSPMELEHIGCEAEKEDYFLLISANRWVKNNYRAIQALDRLFTKGFLKDKKVVVLGAENVPRLQRVKNPDKFSFFGYVEPEKLDEYMRKAYCFIYPTLNEGFGYPPIHAMKYGTPVLASAISAVPEVCGDAASYFNPYSVAEIENRILQIALDTEFYKHLQLKGVANAEHLKTVQEEHLPQLLNHIFKP